MKTRTFAVLLCSSLFAACATSPDVSRSPELDKPQISARSAPPSDDRDYFNAATADTAMVEEWIATAAVSDPSTASELLLRAAEVQLRDGMIDQAEETVRELIIPELSGEQAVRLAIIRARVFRAHAAFANALAQLLDPIVEAAIIDLPLQLQLHFSQLRASLFAIEGKHLAAAQEWIYIYPFLGQSQQQQTRSIIWTSLMEVPTSTLIEHFNSADNRDYLGWLELASIAKDNQGDIEAQVYQRNAWLTRWPQHPAAGNLPGGLDKLEKLVIERPDRIALILPVTGRLATYGKAIRDGFIAAYYEAYGSQGHVPEISQYDSNQGPIEHIYRRALRDSNKMIIGPLLKGNIEELVSKYPRNMPVPTLALNRISGENFPASLYQFGLSPLDEAAQIATIAANKGYKNAMIITPEGSWGTKIADAFANQWHAERGRVVTSASFASEKNNYSKIIKEALQIHESERRRNLLQQIIGQRPQFEPYRRTDIDFIFLVAKPNEGRAINPLLAYHYAGDIPVYATSHIYRGNNEANKDQDINGVQFIDIPWIFNNNSAIRNTINSDIPNSAKYQRLYALGVDSFRLHLRLAQLRNTQSSHVFGETGVLTLNNQGQIERKLSMAVIKNGIAVTTAEVENAN